MPIFSSIFAIPDNFVFTALVSVVVSGIVSYVVNTRQMRKSAEIDYEYEQKKKLSELIGGHHGRLVAASSRFNLRMTNLYRNEKHGWINVSGDYTNEDNYYFRSTIYRFMELYCILRDIEKQAILLDTRIAKEKDFRFLSYVKALKSLASDIGVLSDEDDNVSPQEDHFYSDNLRKYCDTVMVDGVFPAFDEFSKHFSTDSKILGVLTFFDGLEREESRKRWDRLVCIHLLLLSFLNNFGHPADMTVVEDKSSVIDRFYHSPTKTSFEARVKNYHLDGDKDILVLRSRLLA